MTKRAVTPRPFRSVTGILLCILIAGCGYDGESIGLTQKQIEDQTGYRAVPIEHAWVNPAGITMVMQRGLLGGSEQRVGLPNEVAVPGDNHLILRTRTGYLAAARFRFEEFLTRIGGAPPPFEGLTSGEMMSAEDSLGAYVWAEELAGSDLTCIFAMRRLTNSMRDLPADARVMDVMLRNCIRGTREEALAPILDASIGYRAAAGIAAGGSTRMLSPLAAPGIE